MKYVYGMLALSLFTVLSVPAALVVILTGIYWFISCTVLLTLGLLAWLGGLDRTAGNMVSHPMFDDGTYFTKHARVLLAPALYFRQKAKQLDSTIKLNKVQGYVY